MKKKKNPPHFYVKTGKGWTAYYHAVRVDGKLKWTALGSDRNIALREWARLEHMEVPDETKTFNAISTQYMAWAAGQVTSGALAQRTFEDREAYLNQLRPVFGKHQFESIESRHIRLYLDKRTAKIVGKKEMRFLSVLWNWARERGITNKANPVAGVKMPAEVGRTIVVRDQDYWLVYECGDQLVKDVLLLAARLGTRPQEVFTLRWEKIEFLPGDRVKVDIWQPKVKAWRTVMGDRELHDQLRVLRDAHDGSLAWVLCKADGSPIKITGTFRYSFTQARERAAAEAEKREIQFINFQFRDIRPMAGISMLIANGMDAARQMLGHTTEKMTADYTTKRLGMVSQSGTMNRIEQSKGDGS